MHLQSTCSVPGCIHEVAAHGVCGMHYMRQKRHGSLDLPPKKARSIPICSVPDCERKVYAHGLCNMHYQRRQRNGTLDSLHRKPVSVETRFWNLVIQNEQGCWGWKGMPDENGYGRIAIGGSVYRQVLAHRLSYTLHYGPIPEGMHVLHRCDNPPCTRPDHLFLGTHADNMADMKIKGRRKGRMIGEKAPKSKLTAEQVMQIRSRYRGRRQSPSMPQLAAEYGVNKSSIGRIIRGENWKHVTAQLTNPYRKSSSAGLVTIVGGLPPSTTIS